MRADIIPSHEDCHHIFLDDWAEMERPEGVLFVSIPSLLDSSLCPAGTHIVHVFTPDWMDNWRGLAPQEYEARKEKVADELVARMEEKWPGMREAILFRRASPPPLHHHPLL